MSKSSKPWSKEELQAIVNLPTQLVVIIAADGTFDNIGPSGDTLLGWDLDLIYGQKIENFTHPDDYQQTISNIQSLLSGKSEVVKEFTNRCLTSDQTYRWISWTARAHDGRIFALGTDVTQKIEFEEELNIQALVLESITEGVIICNVPGKIVYINSAEENLFGYGPEELLGKQMQMLNALPPEESRIGLIDVFETIKQKGVWIGEWLNVKKNGTLFTTSCRVTNLDLNGERHLVIVQRDITELKARQQEQDELQNRFRIFFEQSILPMEIYDLEGNHLAVNQAWMDLFQVSHDEVFKFNILNNPSLEEMGILPYVRKAYAGEAQNVPAFYADLKKAGLKGRSRWVEAWMSPIQDEQKNIRELAVILKDVTESKETSEKLRQTIAEREVAETRLTMAVSAGRIGIWDWIPGTDKINWDSTLCEIYGFRPGEFSGRVSDFNELMLPSDRDHLWKMVDRAIHELKPYVIEYRVIRPDGKFRWVQESGMAFLEEDGMVRLMGTGIDITDKKLAVLDQEFLSEMSEVLTNSFNYLENLQKMANIATNYFCDGCLIDQLNPDGNIKRIVVASKDPGMKERMQRLHEQYPQRYSHDHPLFVALITGKTMVIPDVIDYSKSYRGKYSAKYLTELEEVKLGGAIVVRLKGKDSLLGTITFFSTVGSHIVLDARAKWLAEELAYRTSMSIENSLLYLHSQEAIKSRDEFLSIASHELKTPLTSLTLQNQMRKRQLDKDNVKGLDEKSLRKMIDADERQLRRINRLIDDMLDIARIRSDRLFIHKEKFEFCNFVTDVLERFTPQMQAVGCKLTVELCPEIIVYGDVYRIEQVVVNMLTNAMKYGAGKPIRIEVVSNPVKVSLMVHDQGPGIDAKDIERIFQRFERAVSGREISGLGLGLYISRQIVEQHDGAMFVTSKMGEGSTFIMELPLNHD